MSNQVPSSPITCRLFVKMTKLPYVMQCVTGMGLGNVDKSDAFVLREYFDGNA